MSNRTIRSVICVLLLAPLACRDSTGPRATFSEELWFLDHTLSGWSIGRLTAVSLRTGETRPVAEMVLRFDWSPDGSKLVLSQSVGDAFVVSTMDADGEGLLHLVRRTFRILDVRWSPDGRSIAFAATHDDLSGDSLWLIDADGSGARPLVDLTSYTTFELARFAWLPGGTAILYQGTDGEYHRVDIRTGFSTQITQGGIAKSEPVLSPDGELLVFACTVEQGPSVCTMRVDGSDLRSFSAGGISVWHPSWSPDSRRIAFLQRDHRDVLGVLYVADRDGTNMAALTLAHPIVTVRTPVWSPDGRRIVYMDNGNGGYSPPGVIRSVATDGTDNREIVRSARLPAWRPARRR